MTYLDDFQYSFNKDYINGKAWLDYENKTDHTTYGLNFKGNITKGGANSVIVWNLIMLICFTAIYIE